MNNFPKDLKDTLLKLRRDLHQYPELGFEEKLTQKRLETALKDLGVTEVQRVADTGLLARIPGTNPSAKKVCIRGDIDALPILENTGLPYTSKHEGLMHACGHDVHASWAVGAGALLKENPAEGDVYILLQPAEELARGALAVLETGCLDNISAIFGGHVDRNYPVGKVVVHEGSIAANSDTFNLTVIGKGGHAARPKEVNSPLPGVSQLIPALGSLVEETVPAGEKAVLSIGSVQAGKTHNVIPDNALLMGTMRSLTPETRQLLKSELTRRVESVLTPLGLSYDLQIDPGAPCIINEKPFIDLALSAVNKVCGEDGVVPLKATNLGAEDFGYYREKIPGCFLRFGARYESGEFIPAHNPAFLAEDETIFVGAGVLAEMARLFYQSK